MRRVVILLIIAFAVGYYFGHTNTKEKIVYRPKTEYIKDPNSVPKSTLDSEVANAKKSSYNAGYAEGRKAGANEGHKSGYTQGMEEGRKVGIDEGYQSGYTQGTEYGKSLILDQIDLRVQEAERTNKNIPLFKVKRE
jgi:flagellar biosynthesis/type III secretory pathway protein FliH